MLQSLFIKFLGNNDDNNQFWCLNTKFLLYTLHSVMSRSSSYISPLITWPKKSIFFFLVLFCNSFCLHLEHHVVCDPFYRWNSQDPSIHILWRVLVILHLLASLRQLVFRFWRHLVVIRIFRYHKLLNPL